jgi:tRNA(Arg) A34 adenosine deaminase TadA
MDRHRRQLDMLSKVASSVERVAGAKLAACIVYKNTVVSFGINQKKSHPFQLKYSSNDDAIYLHAETAAIHAATKHLTAEQFKKATLYIARVKSPNHVDCWGMSKPCEGCTRAIAAFGIKKVVFTCDDGNYATL